MATNNDKERELIAAMCGSKDVAANNDKGKDLIAALEWEIGLKREYTVDEVLKTEKDRGITIGFVGARVGRQTDHIKYLLARIDEEARAISEMAKHGEPSAIFITTPRGSSKLEINGSEPLVFTDEVQDACPIDKFRNEARRKELERLKKERKLWKRK